MLNTFCCLCRDETLLLGLVEFGEHDLAFSFAAQVLQACFGRTHSVKERETSTTLNGIQRHLEILKRNFVRDRLVRQDKCAHTVLAVTLS